MQKVKFVALALLVLATFQTKAQSGCPECPKIPQEGLWKNSIGLSLKAKMEWPLTPILGLEMGANANLNPKRSYLSMDFLITMGWIRDVKNGDFD